MRETKGLVMKITDRYMVVMCDDGKFRNLPLPAQIPGVGERITVSLRQKKSFSLYWFSVVAAVFLLVLGSTLWGKVQPQYSRVVAIDINPSLELFLDSENRVVRFVPLNKDAETLLNGLHLEKKVLNEAIPDILKNSMELGYIKNEKENLIMVSVTQLQNGGTAVDSKSLEILILETLQSHISGFLKVNLVDRHLYYKAKEQGVSVNKFILAQEAQQQGVNLDFGNNADGSESTARVLQKAGLAIDKFFVPFGFQTELPATQGSDEEKRQNNDRSNDQKNKSDHGTYKENRFDQENKSTDSTFSGNSQKYPEYNRSLQTQTNETPVQNSNTSSYPISNGTSTSGSGNSESGTSTPPESGSQIPVNQAPGDPTSTTTQSGTNTTTQSGTNTTTQSGTNTTTQSGTNTTPTTNSPSSTTPTNTVPSNSYPNTSGSGW
ncbi:anti-sigma factor domain-containing protein [Effusibacillus lacus]|uniref:RsgI N-terminal anti-sigma domain-containing protein n=1 Tax=Effusibacillus lacus TaxID=1348429 RepID=A0A292YK98_9BACL|nr:anti-sigma factor domain-containing protein [Effusibacillus lacus]TCS70386.1 anti-sigma factor-like protein [Effusibacillus lacus]GAX91537.1 hypothetical protein EFBL_3227 [Effusibacillus lacus]